MKHEQQNLFGSISTVVRRRKGAARPIHTYARPDKSERRPAVDGEKSCGDCMYFTVRTYPKAECFHAKCKLTHTGSVKTNIAARDAACTKYKEQ